MNERTRGVLVGLAALVAVDSAAASPSSPGEPSAPFPTLENLSIEWPISGDEDLDGRVSVRFRPQRARARGAEPP